MRFYLMFAHPNHAHGRMYNSIQKYLPADMEMIGYIQRDTKVIGRHDFIVTHYGAGTFQPGLAFISPKMVISEMTDPATLSFFKPQDVIFSYEPEVVAKVNQLGYNIHLWPRPVDPEIFYNDESERYIDIIFPSVHSWHNFTKGVAKIAQGMGLRTLAMTQDASYTFGEKAYCRVNMDDDMMRTYYQHAKYVFSAIDEYIYYPGYGSYGFEVGNVEGIFCGATPIIFDVEPSKFWYSDWAKIIQERSIEDGLMDIFSKPYVPLTGSQIQQCVARFNAKKVWADFWDIVRRQMYINSLG